MKKMFEKIKRALASLDKHKKFMLVLFLVFFTLGVVDRQMYLFIFERSMFMPNMKFWLMFTGFYILMFGIVFMFPRVVRHYMLSASLSKWRYVLNMFCISAYAFLIGELVNATNALIMAVFERMAWVA